MALPIVSIDTISVSFLPSDLGHPFTSWIQESSVDETCCQVYCMWYQYSSKNWYQIWCDYMVLTIVLPWIDMIVYNDSTYLYIYIYIYTHMYIYIYIYIHTEYFYLVSANSSTQVTLVWSYLVHYNNGLVAYRLI